MVDKPCNCSFGRKQSYCGHATNRVFTTGTTLGITTLGITTIATTQNWCGYTPAVFITSSKLTDVAATIPRTLVASTTITLTVVVATTATPTITTDYIK
jgi:hypothetical protein